MKKVLIIGSKNTEGKNDPNVLKSSLQDLGASIVYWEDLTFEISNKIQRIIDTASQLDLKEADLVIAVNWYKNGEVRIYRDIAFTTALYLQKNGVEFWNKEMLMQRSTSKLSAMMQLALAGCDIPATRYSLDSNLLTRDVKNYPVILKGMAASRGKQNYLVAGLDELSSRLQKKGNGNRYLLQEFVPNNSDLRIICFGGAPKMVIRRQRQDNSTHLNNTSQGASARLVPLNLLPEPVRDDCVKICKMMGRDIAGIDLLEANDGSSRQVFLEVNAIPQLTSGTFVDEKMTNMHEAIANLLER